MNKKFLLVVFSLLIILSNKAITVNANGNVGSSGYSSGSGMVKHNEKDADVTNKHFEKGNGAKMTVEAGGQSRTWLLFETEAQVATAKAMGMCIDTPCATGSDFGFEGTRIDWDQQLENAGNKATLDGVNFDSSNPISLSYMKAALQLRGIDTSKMSPEEIAATATNIAKEEGGCVNTEFEYVSWVGTWDGQSFICPGDSRCAEAVAESGDFIVNTVDSMNAKKAGTSDWGDLPVKDDPPSYDPIPPVEFSINVNECELVIPEYKSMSSKAIPTSYSSGGTCGSKAISVNYSTSTTACNLVTLLTVKTTTATLPSAPSTVYAGSGFNWGSVTSKTTITTVEWDNSKYLNKQAELEAQKQGYTKAANCTHSRMTKLENECNGKQIVCQGLLSQRANSVASCKRACSEYCSDKEECECSCEGAISSYKDQAQECSSLKASCESSINLLKSQYESYKSDLALVEAQIDELENCEVKLPSNSFKTDTVSLSNEKMKLSNGYTQYINTIKGVAKNSGQLLTSSEINNIFEENYLNVSTDFFIPYYIESGTTGKLVGNISGDISIQNYSCPISVSNLYICDGDCGNTSSNLNLIYRPISLTNPFPNTNDSSKYRKLGSNWTENRVKIFITNNRGVSDYDIYNLTPIYTITLTPSLIKDIREYNKQNSLNDFKMTCVDGYKCLSSFFWNDFNGIVDTENSCASSTGWDQDCYNGGVSE